MTTTVEITVPRPNHQAIRVTVERDGANGGPPAPAASVTLDHGDTHQFHVWPGTTLRIEEVPSARAGAPRLPAVAQD